MFYPVVSITGERTASRGHRPSHPISSKVRDRAERSCWFAVSTGAFVPEMFSLGEVVLHLRKGDEILVASFAASAFIRPFQLHRITPEFLFLPGADVADFAVGVVVPPVTWQWIGDGFAELVRTGRGQCIQSR